MNTSDIDIRELKRRYNCKRVRDLVTISQDASQIFSNYVFSAINYDDVKDYIDENGIISPCYKCNESGIAKIIDYIVFANVNTANNLTALYHSASVRLDFHIVDGKPLSVARLVWENKRTLLTDVLKNKAQRSRYIIFLAEEYYYEDIRFISELNLRLISNRLKELSINMTKYIKVYDRDIYSYLDNIGDMFGYVELDTLLYATEGVNILSPYKVAKSIYSIDKLMELNNNLSITNSFQYIIDYQYEIYDLDYYLYNIYGDGHRSCSLVLSDVNKLHYLQKKFDGLVFDGSIDLTYDQAKSIGIKMLYPSKKSLIGYNCIPAEYNKNIHVLYKCLKYGSTMEVSGSVAISLYNDSYISPETLNRHYIIFDSATLRGKCDNHELMEYFINDISPKLIAVHVALCQTSGCFFSMMRMSKTKSARH